MYGLLYIRYTTDTTVSYPQYSPKGLRDRIARLCSCIAENFLKVLVSLCPGLSAADLIQCQCTAMLFYGKSLSSPPTIKYSAIENS